MLPTAIAAALAATFVLPADILQGRIGGVDPCGRVTATPEEVAAGLEWLSWDPGSRALAVHPGSWDVGEPLLIPRNTSFLVPAGVELKFARHAYLLSCSPVQLMGSVVKPIVLRPADDVAGWLGVHVFGRASLADSVLDRIISSQRYEIAPIIKTKRLRGSRLTSSFSNVVVRGIHSEDMRLEFATGAVSFYRAHVTLENLSITGTDAVDTLNFQHSMFTANNVQMVDSSQDGLDSDFSVGSLSWSRFDRIGGDALDFGTSDVMLKGVDIRNVDDKGISAGEASRLQIEGIHMTGLGIGIAAKDASVVTANGIEVTDVLHFAMMSYETKDGYGPAELSAIDFATDVPEKAAAADLGGSVCLDGDCVTPAEFTTEY